MMAPTTTSTMPNAITPIPPPLFMTSSLGAWPRSSGQVSLPPTCRPERGSAKMTGQCRRTRRRLNRGGLTVAEGPDEEGSVRDLRRSGRDRGELASLLHARQRGQAVRLRSPCRRALAARPPQRQSSHQVEAAIRVSARAFCTDAFLRLDKKICRWETPTMLDVAVIEDPAAAEVSLDPVRARLLAELAEPRSATMLAAVVGLTRQKVNYHLRALERHGLVELVEERRKGNVTERVLRATAGSYVISPLALAAVQPDPSRAPDRLSARWLLAVAARLVRDVG